MDFTRTQLTGLLNNVSHEKARFINIIHKLKALLALNKDNKLVLTSLDKLILTSSPQVIYENLSFPHPILKMLIEFLQKTKKMGDGDRVLIEILKKLVDEISFLLDNGVKPKTISNHLKDISLNDEKFEVEDNSPDLEIVDAVKSMTLEGHITSNLRDYIQSIVIDETATKLLIDAIEYTESFDSEKIRICKVHTGTPEDSYRIDGMLLNRTPEGKVKTASKTTIGIFNCPFDITRTELKGTILMHTSTELLNFSNEEAEMAKKQIDSLNVNVLVVSGTVNELFMDFADLRNLLVLRIFNKYDLKRLCDLVGGAIYNHLGPIPTKGFVENIDIVEDGDCKFTRVLASGKVTTIVLKNSLGEVCDEIERRILTTLENLEKNFSSISAKGVKFSPANFFERVSKDIGTSNIVRARVSKAISGVRCNRMLFADQMRCVRYAIEFLATVLEVDDYLVAKANQLDVKPRANPQWDED